MKVLIFINTSWNIVNFRSGLIKSMQQNDWEVHALAPEDHYSTQLPAMGVQFHPISMDNSGTHPVKDLVLFKNIYDLYQSIRPHLILHYTVKPNIYGTLAAHWCKIPCINTVSGLGTLFLTRSFSATIARKLYRWAFSYPKMIFFQNIQDLNDFQNLDLLTKENYQVVPGSGIDTSLFRPQAPPPPYPFTFLMMSRLLEEKGVREYAAAAEILKAKGLPIECVLIGNPELSHRRGIPWHQVQQWTSRNLIKYEGEISDVMPFIGRAHAIVLPSYREGLPKSLLEGASMAKPIVATRVPGCTDVVKDQINGLLCQPKDAFDLARKMEDLYHLGEHRLAEMGNAGREMVQNQFEEKLVIEKYLETIQKIII